MLAGRALSQGISAGDFALALKGARVLERTPPVAPNVRFLLLAESVRNGDWRRAELQADAIAEDEIFAFMVPVLRAWIAVGAGKRDAITRLSVGASDPLAIAYVAQHRPLMLLASGRESEALELIHKLTASSDNREWRLRLAAAAGMARDGRRQQALALLSGDSDLFVASRNIVAAGKRLPGEIGGGRQGIAEFMLQLALDLRQQDVVELALSFARLSDYLNPEYSEAKLLIGELLSAQGSQAAITAFRGVPSGDPFAGAAQDAGIRMLASAGDETAALRQAEAAAKARDADVADWTRLGDLYGELRRYQESADAYGQALQVAQTNGGRRPEWTLWLLHGGALEQADRWTEAKAALEAAYKLAPEEPMVLNYLGYSQLERRENIDGAEKLISRASALAPNSPQITDSLGWARFLKGDVAKAIELLEQAIQGEPSDPAIYEHLGDAYYSAGRRFEARYAWNAALATANEQDVSRLRTKLEVGLRPDLTSP